MKLYIFIYACNYIILYNRFVKTLYIKYWLAIVVLSEDFSVKSVTELSTFARPLIVLREDYRRYDR